MKKDNFIKYLEDIIKYEEKIDKLYDDTSGVINCYNDDDFFCLVNNMVEVLEIEMKDTKNQWISYYLWECDLGKKTAGKIKDEKGLEVDISTIEKFYDFLVEEKR